MNYIILNGVDSRTITGLMIQELPPIIKPAMRTQVEEIDGRDGDITTPLGYAAYDRAVTIGLYGNYDIDAVIEFFNSSGTAIFSNEADKIYTYSITDQIDFERLIRFRTAEINLHVQPFKFSTAEKPLTLTPVTASGQGLSVTLQPTVKGEPLDTIAIYGDSNQSGTPSPSIPLRVNTVTGTINVQFTSGALSSTTPLNLGGLELCKISTYQDFIHQTAGTWAKHTAIQSFTVDTDTVTIQSYSNVHYAVIPAPSNALCYGNYKDIPCLCTHAAYSYGLNEGWNTANAVNKIFCQADANSFWLGFPAGTTLAQAQTALNGCIIYYVLLNRIDVPISSETLQEQFDALLEVGLYDGTTTITTSAGLQPTISASAIMERFAVTNTGNVYARPTITLEGNGTATLTVNGQQLFVIELDGNITIDGAALEAYQDTPSNLKNRSVTGSYDNFILPIGKNTIEFSNNVTQATISNYSRWL